MTKMAINGLDKGVSWNSNTNAAIAAVCHQQTNQPVGGDDAEMEDSSPSATNMTEKVMVTAALWSAMYHGLEEPMKAFRDAHKAIELGKRLTIATKPAQWEDTAACIAAVVAQEKSATPTTLRGLVREEAVQESQSVESKLRKELDSLRKEVNELKSAPLPKGKKTVTPSPKNGGGGSKGQSKAGASAAPKSKRSKIKKSKGEANGAEGNKPDSAAASKSKTPGRTNAKSGGKQPASKPRKRN